MAYVLTVSDLDAVVTLSPKEVSDLRASLDHRLTAPVEILAAEQHDETLRILRAHGALGPEPDQPEGVS